MLPNILTCNESIRIKKHKYSYNLSTQIVKYESHLQNTVIFYTFFSLQFSCHTHQPTELGYSYTHLKPIQPLFFLLYPPSILQSIFYSNP